MVSRIVKKGTAEPPLLMLLGRLTLALFGRCCVWGASLLFRRVCHILRHSFDPLFGRRRFLFVVRGPQYFILVSPVPVSIFIRRHFHHHREWVHCYAYEI